MSEPTQPNNNPGPWNTGQPGQPGPGQPAPGQNGYGYPAPAGPPQPGHSNYPGPGGQPQGYAYPGSPYGQMPQAENPARPKQVNMGFWLLVGSAILGLLTLPFAISFMNSPEFIDNLQGVAREANVELDSAFISTAIAGSTFSTVLSGIFALAVSVGLAFLVRAGFNWARILVTIFAAFSLFGIFDLFFTGPIAGVLTLAQILVTVGAVVLLFMKPSSEYFARKKAYRQAQKFGGYQA
jgi:ABC-type multidrug transport system fused ATPase/permease subunit